MKDVEIEVKPFNGNGCITGDSIKFATYDVKSHLNVYIRRATASNASVCMNYEDGLELATKLAIAYGLIPDEMIVLRKVVVDSDGNFLRFPN